MIQKEKSWKSNNLLSKKAIRKPVALKESIAYRYDRDTGLGIRLDDRFDDFEDFSYKEDTRQFLESYLFEMGYLQGSNNHPPIDEILEDLKTAGENGDYSALGTENYSDRGLRLCFISDPSTVSKIVPDFMSEELFLNNLYNEAFDEIDYYARLSVAEELLEDYFSDDDYFDSLED